MGFDGAFDFDELSPAKLPLDVHKPLPHDPPPDRVKPALTIGVAPSFTYSQDTTFRPSTASTTSTGITTSSSRRAFGDVTKALLQMDAHFNHADDSHVRAFGRVPEPAKPVTVTSKQRPRS